MLAMLRSTDATKYFVYYILHRGLRYPVGKCRSLGSASIYEMYLEYVSMYLSMYLYLCPSIYAAMYLRVSRMYSIYECRI